MQSLKLGQQLATAGTTDLLYDTHGHDPPTNFPNLVLATDYESFSP